MIRAMIRALVIGLLFAGTSFPAWGVEPSEMLADPVLEGRARVISKQLRCLVCQNQSIDESEAELARDLRVIVRERLVAGDSDDEVIEFIVARYGDWVLLNPPFKVKTLALWLAPLGIVGITGLMYLSFFRRQGPVTDGAVEPPRHGGKTAAKDV